MGVVHWYAYLLLAKRISKYRFVLVIVSVPVERLKVTV